MAVDINTFEREIEYTFKNERYSVRDNGAVFRHAFKNKRPRPTDNKWTFGKVNSKTGYLKIASISIHRLIAKAFHGEPPTNEHVVDHIDTNKQNNRPENLRWVTRFENIILNPITAKRIARVCGSVEAFLADPAKFKDKFQEPNLKWMQPVTAEEAQICRERLLEWAYSDTQGSGMTLDEWIFNRGRISSSFQENAEIESLTPNAVQDWKTPTEFPLCPQEIKDNIIETYAANLAIGEIFSRNRIFEAIILDFAMSKDKNTLWVMCKKNIDDEIKRWLLVGVTYENEMFVHSNLGSFFEKVGAEKKFTLAQGLDWTGGDSIDDWS